MVDQENIDKVKKHFLLAIDELKKHQLEYPEHKQEAQMLANVFEKGKERFENYAPDQLEKNQLIGMSVGLARSIYEYSFSESDHYTISGAVDKLCRSIRELSKTIEK